MGNGDPLALDGGRRVSDSPLSTLVQRRIDGAYTLDEWGFDPDFVELLSPLLGARWSISVEGAEHIPAEGAAVLVANRGFGMSEPFVVAGAVRATTGRVLRVLGIPDIAPVGPFLRRLGAAQCRPDELRGLARAGELTVLFLDRQPRRGARVGHLGHELLSPAIEMGVPVIPVALIGRELGRRWVASVGEPVVPRTATGFGPLAVAETIDGARRAIQEALDDR